MSDIRLRQQSCYVKDLKAEELPESFKNMIPRAPKPSIKDIINKVISYSIKIHQGHTRRIIVKV